MGLITDKKFLRSKRFCSSQSDFSSISWIQQETGMKYQETINRKLWSEYFLNFISSVQKISVQIELNFHSEDRSPWR